MNHNQPVYQTEVIVPCAVVPTIKEALNQYLVRGHRRGPELELQEFKDGSAVLRCCDDEVTSDLCLEFFLQSMTQGD